jgi:hypothetical protein
MTQTQNLAILYEISAERQRQDQKWGEQNHPDGTGDDVLLFHNRVPATSTDTTSPTFGTMAYVARDTTDDMAAQGKVTYADILLEEVFEALAEQDPAKVRKELIQVAAVAVQWVQKIDRDTARRA